MILALHKQSTWAGQEAELDAEKAPALLRMPGPTIVTKPQQLMPGSALRQVYRRWQLRLWSLLTLSNSRSTNTSRVGTSPFKWTSWLCGCVAGDWKKISNSSQNSSGYFFKSCEPLAKQSWRDVHASHALLAVLVLYSRDVNYKPRDNPPLCARCCHFLGLSRYLVRECKLRAFKWDIVSDARKMARATVRAQSGGLSRGS